MRFLVAWAVLCFCSVAVITACFQTFYWVGGVRAVCVLLLALRQFDFLACYFYAHLCFWLCASSGNEAGVFLCCGIRVVVFVLPCCICRPHYFVSILVSFVVVSLCSSRKLLVLLSPSHR